VTTTTPTRTEEIARPGRSRLRLDSPVGQLVLVGNDDGLTYIHLPGDAPDADDDGPPGTVASPVRDAARQLDQYFAGRRRAFDFELRPSGTAFQLAVWWALEGIGYGTTISYAELARRVGRPRAFRAVGQANGANPIPIVLPCHRVIASGGGIGGYGGGLGMKRALLALETGGAAA
jgi:methylated-DNA-[protein]-cysteine S-methyltransferase